MPTLIFDFDSTLVCCESLEEIAQEQLRDDAERAARYHDLTARGMAGNVSFHESLRDRLAIARPHRRNLADFASQLPRFWTAGMPALIQELTSAGHDIWIVSGAPVEVLFEGGAILGVPRERIRGVRLRWSMSGECEGIDPADAFSRSKVEGLAGLAETWQRPRVMIGDGATDRAVYESGLVDFFIPFTAHIRRPEVLVDGMPEAGSTERLRELIESYVWQ